MTLAANAALQRPLRRPRLAAAVVEDLVNAIVTEIHPSGSALPPENVLCDIYGVSRTVVREATTALTEKGLGSCHSRDGAPSFRIRRRGTCWTR